MRMGHACQATTSQKGCELGLGLRKCVTRMSYGKSLEIRIADRTYLHHMGVMQPVVECA